MFDTKLNAYASYFDNKISAEIFLDMICIHCTDLLSGGLHFFRNNLARLDTSVDNAVRLDESKGLVSQPVSCWI